MEHQHPGIVVLGYSEAAMFLRSELGPRVVGIISIHGSQEYGVEADVLHRLDLTFDDVASPDAGDFVAAYHARMHLHAQQEMGRTLRPPQREDVAAIVQFAKSVQHLKGLVLCHCLGGVSRSPAAALICLAAWRGNGHEEECMAALKNVRACAYPHPDLVRHGDALLGCDGRLMAAAERQ